MLAKKSPLKKIMVIAILLLTIPTLKAQKKEIRKAQKEVSAGNFESAASYLNQAKRIFAAADRETRAEYYIVEAELHLAEKAIDINQIALISQSLKMANNYEVTSSLQNRISQINSKIHTLSATIADGEFANKNYQNAAALYQQAYQSTNNNTHLLKAARSFLLAKAYNDAFKSYQDLIAINTSNTKTQYIATNVKSKKREAFASVAERDEAVADGLYKNPEIITTNSKLPEILRGITMAAIPLEKNYQAVAIIDKAIAKTPGNKRLLNQVSHLYKELGAHEKYIAILDQFIKDTPNNPNLYFNAGLASAENNSLVSAKIYYKKALKIAPNHTKSQANISLLLLEEEKKISDEMNALGTSDSENKKYEKLKKKRIDLYYEVLPYLKSIVKSDYQDQIFTKKLKQIYTFLGKDSQLAQLEEDEDDE